MIPLERFAHARFFARHFVGVEASLSRSQVESLAVRDDIPASREESSPRPPAHRSSGESCTPTPLGDAAVTGERPFTSLSPSPSSCPEPSLHPYQLRVTDMPAVSPLARPETRPRETSILASCAAILFLPFPPSLLHVHRRPDLGRGVVHSGAEDHGFL